MDETDLNSFLTGLADTALNQGKPAKAPPKEEEVEEELTEEEPEENEETTEVESDEPEEESEENEEADVLSQIDLDALTKEQKVELAERLGSGLGKEVASYRKEAKEAREKLEAAERKLEQFKGKVVGPQPYANAKTIDELEEAVEADRSQKAKIKSLLRQEPVYRDEDMQEGPKGYRIGNDFYAKAEVEAYFDELDSRIENAALQRERIKERGQYSEAIKSSLEEVKAYSWFDNKESDTFAKWKELMDDEEVKLVQEISPRIAAKLPALVAAWVDKKRTVKNLKLPIKKQKPDGAKQEGALGSRKRLSSKEAAAKRIESGQYSPDDIVNAYFM